MPNGAQKATDSARDKLKLITQRLKGASLESFQVEGILYEIEALRSVVEKAEKQKDVEE